MKFNIFIIIVFLLTIFCVDFKLLYAYQEPGNTFFDQHDEKLKSQIKRGTEIKKVNQSEDLFGLTYAWINFAFGFLGILTLVLIIFYAYKAIVFSYDENVLKKVYKILLYLVVGFGIILFSYLIVKFFVST